MNEDVIIVTVKIGDGEPVVREVGGDRPAALPEGCLRFRRRWKSDGGRALVLQQKIQRGGHDVWIDVPVVDDSGDSA